MTAPDGTERRPKRDYLAQVEEFRQDWLLIQGKLRLLLPEKGRAFHQEVIDRLNDFRAAVKDHLADNESDATKKEIGKAFDALKSAHDELEAELRAFLRTQRLVVGTE